jgi:hypothetical protein
MLAFPEWTLRQRAERGSSRQKQQSLIFAKIVREYRTLMSLFEEMTVFVRAVEAESFSAPPAGWGSPSRW